MKIRIKHEGAAEAVQLDDGAVMGDLRSRVRSHFKLSADVHIAFRVGFPPKLVDASDATSLVDAGIGNGVQAEVVKTAPQSSSAGASSSRGPASSHTSTHTSTPAPAHTPAAASSSAPTPAAAAASSQWSCGACTFLNAASASTCEMCGTVRARAVMERHVVPADNSCFFTSLGYVFHSRRMDLAPRMRKEIADYMLSHPDEYNEALLGKPTAEYARYIQRPEIWGGGVECAAATQMLAAEIVAIDIQTCKPQIFGQDKHYRNRVFLLYDGIHWDALQRKAPDGTVTTVFSVDDPEAMNDALTLAAELHKKHAFTDMAGFTLRCLVCREGIKGAKEAQEHARATGHQNFAEYK